MLQNRILEDVKLILQSEDDDRLDRLLLFYVNNAINEAHNLTGLSEIPTTLETTVAQMAVFRYRYRGFENVSADTTGAVSHTYAVKYPDNIIEQLDSFRRVTVV